MVNILDELERVRLHAKRDPDFCRQLLMTRESDNSITDFCRICGDFGYSISAIDLISAGEEAYAAMKRSTNGGGENSPMLEGEDDLYDMFMISIQ